ncbi:MAG: BatA domain-containing protein, partial [Roseicyclus sp.]|nr:BatA domain-containing protein [Roseicyclus sp.]
MIGALGFATPLLLLALISLPVLWWLLRAVPPAPIRRRFPGIALLLGLTDDESQTDKTPWWLLLLRMLAVAAAIIGFAGPILNPQEDRVAGDGPLLIVMDASWASARDWAARLDRVGLLLDDAERAGREVALVMLTQVSPGAPPFQAANAWAPRVPTLEPAPYAPNMAAAVEWAGALDGPVEVFWFSDGVAHPGRADLAEAFAGLGELSVFQGARELIALAPPRFEDGLVRADLSRLGADTPREVTVVAHGLDPAGLPRDLARATATFDPGEMVAQVAFDLPPELRNRITRFELSGERHAGAIALTDDALQRRQVALI